MEMLKPAPRVLPKDVIATGVSEEDYLDYYAEQHCEYLDGMVIKMSPVRMEHDKYFQFLIILFNTYFELNPIGTLRVEPFVMELAPHLKREPDLMIILDSNSGKLDDTVMRGAADLCVEIVSPGSVERDYHDKYLEYQQFGVRILVA